MSNEITKTGGNQLAKDDDFEAQQAALDRDEADRQAAREGMAQRASEGAPMTGTDAAIQRYNQAPLAEHPEIEKRAASLRSAAIERAPTPEGVYKLHYRCMNCGWHGTLEFDPSDTEDAATLESIGGELAAYSGPCKSCKFNMLVPHDALFHETLGDVREAETRAHAGIVADAVLDKVIDRGGDVLMGMAGKAAQMTGIGDPADEGREPEQLPEDAGDGEDA